MQRCIGVILKQLSEKIDRVRLVAGSVLQELFDNHIEHLPEFAHRDVLKNLFCLEGIKVRMQEEKENVEMDFDVPTIGVFNDENDVLKDKNKLVFYWNLPHCVYPIVTQLMEYPEYTS